LATSARSIQFRAKDSQQPICINFGTILAQFVQRFPNEARLVGWTPSLKQIL
jgi:hypothetical protein